MESPYFADYGSMFLILVSAGICAYAHVYNDRFYFSARWFDDFLYSLLIILIGVFVFVLICVVVEDYVFESSNPPINGSRTPYPITHERLSNALGVASFVALSVSFIVYMFASFFELMDIQRRRNVANAIANAETPSAPEMQRTRIAETQSLGANRLRRSERSHEERSLTARRDQARNQSYVAQETIRRLEAQRATLRARAATTAPSHATASAAGSSNEDPRPPSSRRGSRRQMLRRERTKKR
jgi:hypothetical protein